MTLLRSERFAALLLVAAAAVGLILANSPLAAPAKAVEGFYLTIPWLGIDLTVGHWVKDGLLAIFFFIAAIELRHELRHGELNSARKALIPAAAAVGGVIVPALIFLVLVRDPALAQGWPIPTATDIAFALGVLAIVGRGLPPTFRALLLAIAVIDDLIAILIIAVFFTDNLQPIPLLVAVPVVLFFGWLSYRVRGRQRGWVIAALVPIPTANLGELSPAFWGVLVALPVGKIIGITAGAVIAASLAERRSRGRQLPLPDVIAVAALGGIGFTVSLLMNELAFEPQPEVADEVTLAVIAGSLIAAIIGGVLTAVRARTHRANATRPE